MTRLLRFATTLALALPLAAHAASLTVYAAMGYDQAVVDAFSRATGVQVALVHLSTGPLLARVQAEGQRAQWDVLWFDGDVPMRALADRGLLACGWSPAVDYNALGRSLLQPRDCSLPTGMTEAGVILVDTTRVAPADVPRTWADLLRPGLRGRVGMNDPSISGPTYPFVAGMLQSQGSAAGQRWFGALKTAGLHVYPTNSVTLRALEYGQISVAVVQSSAAAGFAAAHPGMRVIVPTPVTALPSDIAIGAQVRGERMALARRFVAFVLSPAGQAAMRRGDPGADSRFTSLLAGVSPDAAATPAAQVQTLDPAWGPREPAVDAWFTAHVVR